MDPAQQVELHARRHQQSMNEALARGAGDSAVCQYYRGATVFVTGGFGFLGKQLTEKLLRSCAIKKIYLLARSKKGKTIKERLEHILKDPVYDVLREKQPQFAKLIVPVEGDVADVRLGLSDQARDMLATEVNIIIHEAGTVRFDEPLRLATLINVRGTREVLALAKHCAHLKKLVHVSTAFVHATAERIGTEVEEQFYPSPMPPAALIQLAECVNQRRLDAITADLIKGWPNTYTFTKALAEELLRTSAGDIPVCIVRPSVVLPAYYEPSPGWLDITTLAGPSWILLGGGLGVIHAVLTDADCDMPMCPVDYANNAIIAAAWHSAHTAHTANDTQLQIPIYTIRKKLRFGYIKEVFTKERSTMMTSRLVWNTFLFEIKNRHLYALVSLFLHYIPAFSLDCICTLIGKKPKEIPSFVSFYKKLDKLVTLYNYFLTNAWDFKVTNLQQMVDSMSTADRAIFNCDVSTVDPYEYILVWNIGLRKYIIKDGLKDTHEGIRKHRMLTFVNYIVVGLYSYVLWYIFSTVCTIIKSIVLLF